MIPAEAVEAVVLRVFTTDRAWVQVVNHDWDPQQVPKYTPDETPIRPGYVRRFND